MKPIRNSQKERESIRHQLLVSVGFALGIIVSLSVLVFLAEKRVQPEIFGNCLNVLVWTCAQSIGVNGIIDGSPVTIFGKGVWMMLGIVKVAIVAIPAGLLGSAFVSRMNERQRRKKLELASIKLKKAFSPKQCRYTRLRTIPAYLSVTTIQAKYQMTLKDIVDAVEDNGCFRLRNLADALNAGLYPADRLVVEHFKLTEGCPYGQIIDRRSNVTIVSTSSVSEPGISNFAYYIAEIGKFNFISKELERDPENPVNYYWVTKPDDKGVQQFIADIRSFAPTEKHWVVFLLSASGAEEPQYDTDFHFVTGAKRGDEGYSDPNLTIRDTTKFKAFYDQAKSRLWSEFGYDSDQNRHHSTASAHNIARLVGGGSATNAFTLRVSFKVTVWDDRHIAIANLIAETIKRTLC